MHTTTCIKSVINHLLSNKTCKYILTAKFQTDALESRFGLYRQMSGSSYHVTVQELLESERKLRVKNILNLNSSSLGEMSIKHLFTQFVQPSTTDIDISKFENILADLHPKATNNEIQILTYIGSYCVDSLKLMCKECQLNFSSEEILLVESEDEKNLPVPADMNTDDIDTFLNMINKGGLKKPSSLVINILIHSFSIFRKIISEEYELDFQNSTNQHGVLVALIILYTKNYLLLNFDENCTSCNSIQSKYVSKIINSFSNTCLRNYTKMLCDKKFDNLNERKVKKFKK